jgi:uncharacterized protein (DUF58 family)
MQWIQDNMSLVLIAAGSLLFVLAVVLLVVVLARRKEKHGGDGIPLPDTTQTLLRKDLIRKVRSIEIHTRHVVDDVFAGQYHSAFNFPGDDIRDIDWNVTARMSQPFIKKFKEERELTVFLVVDVSASMFFGSHGKSKKEVAAEITALLAFSAIKNNDKVGLILYTDEVEKYVPPGKGSRHVLRVISEVLEFAPKSRGTRVEPAIDFLNHVSKRKSVVFLVSDYLVGDEFMRPLTVTGRRHDVVSIIFGDKHEASLPRAGLMEWQDMEKGQRYLIDTSNALTRKRFQSLQAQRREHLLRNLKRANIDAIEIDASDPEYDRVFMKFFRMRTARMKTR